LQLVPPVASRSVAMALLSLVIGVATSHLPN
jgi:hypothetical protein